MSPLFLLFDVPVDPVSRVPWAGLILLLVVVFVLAVTLVGGIVFLLIRHQRNKAKATSAQVAPGGLS